ncbi:MAG TPA: Hsp20/alpha crystallin family protein [Pyrinomonadaceae bacterium]|nr:Hsp20/alpha crystallin family protein [Pyrinomonadaceae bacterium]
MGNQKSEKQIKGNGPKALERTANRSEELASRLTKTPFAFMRRFGEEMDQIFEDFGLGGGWLAPVFKGQFGDGLWSPQVEMLERDGELIVRADLPGLTKDDVKVEVADNAITIEGERKGEKEEKGEGFYRSERSYGKFYRRLPVPEGANAGNATATFNNGVLEITMPAARHLGQKARRLEISEDRHTQAKRKAA